MQNIKIQHLSKKVVKSILSTLEKRWDIDPNFIDILREAESVQIAYTEKFEIVVFDTIAALFKVQGKDLYIPTLYVINMLYNTKKLLVVPAVVVDQGAVEPLKRGADVMIPGIKKVLKNFDKGDIVAVMEPGEKYAIVVGLALVSSAAIVPGARGKGVENISHLDDEIWSTSLQLVRALSTKQT
ncbi:MAG: PUA domain-containing protein [Ignisphaera sp.]